MDFGIVRCIRPDCGGFLGASGQEVVRYICQRCGQNYFLCVNLEPVAPHNPPKILPGDRAE